MIQGRFQKQLRMRKNLIWRNVFISALFAFGLTAVLGGLGIYWYVQQPKLNDLQQQINRLPDGKDRVVLVKDRIALENTINSTLVQAFGGFGLIVTAFVSIQNLRATQQNVMLTEEKQITERFTQAISQLGSNEITIRVGAIYALERIAKDSEQDHWAIMEI